MIEFRVFKKCTAGLAFLASTLLVTSSPTEPRNFQEYVEANLEQILKRQERKVSIAFPQRRPLIIYHLPENSDENDLGKYKLDENTIYLRGDMLDTIDWNFSQARATLDHELAHWYCDTLSESLGKGDWPDYNHSDTLEQSLALRLLSEGIAEYVERTMNGGEDSFDEEEWPKSVLGFIMPMLPPNSAGPDYILNSRVIYDGGYHLVKPIIDKYGPQGIEYLMFDPPTDEELFDLPSYQKRILQELAQQQP